MKIQDKFITDKKIQIRVDKHLVRKVVSPAVQETDFLKFKSQYS